MSGFRFAGFSAPEKATDLALAFIRRAAEKGGWWLRAMKPDDRKRVESPAASLMSIHASSIRLRGGSPQRIAVQTGFDPGQGDDLFARNLLRRITGIGANQADAPKIERRFEILNRHELFTPDA